MTVCAECDKARQAAAGDRLVYTFQFFDVGLLVGFDVGRARAFMADTLAGLAAHLERGGSVHEVEHQLARMSVPDVRRWLDQYATINRAHLAHIPRDRLAEPGLLVDFGPECIPDRLAAFRQLVAIAQAQTILLDGNHRAALAVDAGDDYVVYVLTAEQARECIATIGVGALPNLVRPDGELSA